MPRTAHQQNPTRYAVCVVVALTLGAAIVRSPSIVALAVPTVVAVMALVLTVRWLTEPDDSEAQRRVLRWTLFAFAAHLAAGLLITNVASAVQYFGGDALGYHGGAIGLVRHWTEGFPEPLFPSGKHGFYYVLGAIYWVFGPHTAAGLVLNSTLAATLVPFLYDITRRLFGSAAPRALPALAVLMPGLFIWTSQLLKEAAMLFLLVVATYCAVRLIERIALGPLVGLGIALSLSFTLRSSVALVFAVALVAGIVLGKSELLGGLSTGLGVLAAMSVLVFAFGVGYSGYESATSSDLEHVNLVRQDFSTAASGFASGVDVSTPKKALSYLPVGMVSVGLGPFPWQIENARQLPAIVDTMVWWALLPSLWRGLRAGWRRAGRRLLILLLPAIVTVALVGLTVANYGTVVRERTQIVVMLLPLIALGLSQRSAGRSQAPRADALARVA